MVVSTNSSPPIHHHHNNESHETSTTNQTKDQPEPTTTAVATQTSFHTAVTNESQTITVNEPKENSRLAVMSPITMCFQRMLGAGTYIDDARVLLLYQHKQLTHTKTLFSICRRQPK